jgi:hypothetical protein
MAAILGSITFTALVTYFVLAAASRVRQVMGETGHPHPGEDHGPAAGGAGHAVFREWNHGLGADSAALKSARCQGQRRALVSADNSGIQSARSTFPQKRGLSTGWALASNRLKLLFF